MRVCDRDLVAAGLATYDKQTKRTHKADARGRTLDIHSLRGTFASMMAATGVPLATAQVLMRHSTPTLTAKHYVDPAMLDTAGAVERLPAAHPEAQERATGTAVHAADSGAEKRPPFRPPVQAKTRQNVAIAGSKAGNYEDMTAEQQETRIANNDRSFRGVAARDNECKEWYRGRDLNPGPLDPQSSALTKLSYLGPCSPGV